MISKLRENPSFVIFFFFLISCLLRFHVFKSPIGGSHTWLSAHVVLTSSIWDSNNPVNYHLNPVYTFNEAPDKNMRSLASGIHDDEGNYYYVSYPPFSFILAFLFTKLLFISPNLEGLQILNLLTQLGTAFLIYLIVCTIYKQSSTKNIFPTALIASLFYLFSAQTLWCHIYMYFADTLIQILWCACIYVSLLIFHRGRITDWKLLTLLSIINFLSVYTEWLGLLTAFVLMIYSLFRALQDKIFLRVFLLIGISTTLALTLTLLQFSAISGLDNFIEASLSKYIDRSGYSEHGLYYATINFLRLLKFYWNLHKANFIIILFLLCCSLILTRRIREKINHGYFFLSLVCLGPILAHHFLFLEFSSKHDFSTLKSTVPICLIIAVLYNRVINSNQSAETKKLLVTVTNFLVALIIILNISIYFSTIDFGGRNIFSIASHQINITAHKDESLYSLSINDWENGIMVYMGSDRAFSPQIQLITQRNILATSSRNNVIKHMREFHNHQGKIYIFDKYGKLIGIESLNIRSDY